jgi:hypothetical protein
VTTIDCVVAPFDHRYVKPSGALSVTEPPSQNAVGPLAVMSGVEGFAFTVTAVAADVAEQPLPFVTVTLYEPDAETTIDCVVASVLQRYVKPSGAVSVTDPPSQNVVGPLGVIAGVEGFASTVTVVASDVAEQPLAFVTVTPYEPDSLTAIDCVVAPFDHSHDAAPGAVSVTLPPAQNVVGPDGAIDATGSAFTVTTVAGDVAPQPFAPVTVTV